MDENQNTNIEENIPPVEQTEEQPVEEQPAEEQPVFTSSDFTYVGEDELKYFLSLINRLGDLKYMPIDKVPEKALAAIEAGRLSKSVLINGQSFDGTQDITFDEFAKTIDVVGKKDCAVIGAEDNGNKVAVLNEDGKVDNGFINYEYILEKIREDALKQIEDDIQAQKKQYEEDTAVFSDDNKKQDTDIAAIKNYIGMKQMRINASKPSSKVDIKDVKYDSYCIPPIEVLKEISEVKTANLNYVNLDYHGDKDASYTVKDNSIDVKPVRVKKSLLIREKFSEVDLNNYKDYPDALQKTQPFPIEDKTYYILSTCPFNTKGLSSSAVLLLKQPKGKFYCAAFVDDQTVYRINGETLVKGYSAPEALDFQNIDPKILAEALLDVKKSTPDTLVNTDMVRELRSDKVRLVFCFEQEQDLDCPDMTINDLPKEGFIIDTDTMLSSQVSKINSITAKSVCIDSSIRFGVKKSDGTNFKYAVWDAENGKWKGVDAPKEIGTQGTLLEDLAKIPVSSLNTEDMDFALVFAFIPTAMDATCTLNAIEVSCIGAAAYEKAVHGADYSYALGKRVISMTFEKAGKYIVNYPVTDVLPSYDRIITEISPK